MAVLLGTFWWSTTRGGADQAASQDGERARSVTAPVERRVLESLQVTRGTVVSPSQATVRAPAPAEGELAVVVTGLPVAQGSGVGAGAVVVELNGRPVLALPGVIPFFRDIRPGMTGPDVAAVQVALQVMGYDISDREHEQSQFGWTTREAVEALYEQAGYEPHYTLGSREAVAQAISQADATVTAAETALDGTQADETAQQVALDEARANRDRVRADEGVLLRVRELVAVPVLPAMLVDLPVALGEPLDPGAPVATIGSNQFQVQVELTDAQVNELAPDVEIAVFSEGYEATCPPADVRQAEADAEPQEGGSSESADEEQPDAETTAQQGSPTMTVTCTPLPPADALGANLRVTMTVRRSDGPVLVVPATAISTTPSGDSLVEVVAEDGDVRRVAVAVGGEADGFVAVQPGADGSLTEGMDVRVRRG